MALISFSIFDAFFSSFQTSEKINCFHCDEKMKKHKALFTEFNGKSCPVCCHGCAAVLQVIERNGMTKQYLQAKSEMNVAELAE
ncbi:MAG: heavy metal translocating P-type ATPase metal-binding domain-containing protein [Pseudomonadota bacterium]